MGKYDRRFTRKASIKQKTIKFVFSPEHEIIVDFNQMPESIKTQLLFLALVRKVSAAISKIPKNDTVGAFNATVELIDRLNNENWR